VVTDFQKYASFGQMSFLLSVTQEYGKHYNYMFRFWSDNQGQTGHLTLPAYASAQMGWYLLYLHYLRVKCIIIIYV
jgi:hypothetical protein